MKLSVRLLLPLSVLIASSAGAQISNVPPASVDGSAEFQIDATNKGALFPRMTAAQRIAIAMPANGLLVYDTDSSAYMLHAASGWTRLMSTNQNNHWQRRGDSLFASPAARLGIGTSSPKTRLSVVDSLGGISIRKTLAPDSAITFIEPALKVVVDSGSLRRNTGNGGFFPAIGIENRVGAGMRVEGLYGITTVTSDLGLRAIVTGDPRFSSAIHASTPGYAGTALNAEGRVIINCSVPDPMDEALIVGGAIQLGGTVHNNTGTMRFTGSDFEGFDGVSWRSFTGAGTGFWSANGANVYNNNPGNVGIGTLTPKTRFQVEGPSASVLFGTDTVSGAGWQWMPQHGAIRSGLATTGRTGGWADSTIGAGSFAHGEDNKALGTYSVAFGSQNRLGADFAFAAGTGNRAGLSASAFGQQNNSSGDYAFTAGQNNMAGGHGAMAIGTQNLAAEFGGVALGYRDTAKGAYATATGFLNHATGSSSFVSGFQNTATGTASSASGERNTVHAPGASALGNSNRIDSSASESFAAGHKNYIFSLNGRSVALGDSNTVAGTGAIALGKQNRATGNSSIVAGEGSLATGSHALAIGNMAQSLGSSSTAIGEIAKARADHSIALGFGAYSDHVGVVTIGFGPYADGAYSTAIGHQAQAQGDYSVAINDQARAYGGGSTAIGNSSIASGDYSMSAGYGTQARSFGSTALGMLNDTTGAGSQTGFSPTDQLLVVGNGSQQARSNSMTMLKNGRTGFGTDLPKARIDVEGPIRVSTSSGYSDVAGLIRFTGTVFEGYNGTAWQPFAGSGPQTLSISGSTLSISGGNSVALPAGGGSSQWNAVNTDDIQNGNPGRVLIGSEITAPYSSVKGRLVVRDTIAFGTGIRSFTNASYSSAIVAHDSAISGNPRGCVGCGGQEALNLYSRHGDAIFAHSRTRGIYLKGGSGFYPAMVIDTNGGAAALQLNGPLMLSYGTPGAGKVLTSDASGTASWQTPSGAYTAGSGISISGGVIAANDNSATNELQNLSISGTTLSISGGNSITLPSGGGGGQWAATSTGIRNAAGPQVSINATTPRTDYALDVRDTNRTGKVANFMADYPDARIEIGGNNAVQGYISAASGSGTVQLGTLSGGNLELAQAGIPKLIIDAATGYTMIGNGTPMEQLDVSGGLRIGYTTHTNNGAIRYDWLSGKFEGYHNGWVDLSAPTGSNFWTRSGANISSNSPGKVGIGTSAPVAKLHVADSSVIFAGPGFMPFVAPPPPVVGYGTRMMWYAEKAAFLTGGVQARTSAWNADSIGRFAFNAGLDNSSSGEYSVTLGINNRVRTSSGFAAGTGNHVENGIGAGAIGNLNLVSGQHALALGRENTVAEGSQNMAFGTGNTSNAHQGSMAIGTSSRASGTFSTAMGYKSHARSYLSTALGINSDSLQSSVDGYWVSTDPLLTVGNGFNTPHNAMTLLKNGKLGINTDSAHSFVQIRGSFATSIRTETGYFTATDEDYTIIMDASATATTLSLPSAAGIAGRSYVIKKKDATTNAVTIQAAGLETIDGASSQSLSAQWKYMTVQSDGSDWMIIANN